MRVSLHDHIINDKVYVKTKQEPITDTIKKRRLRWLGNVIHINEKH